jgi:hypothetical protein
LNQDLNLPPPATLTPFDGSLAIQPEMTKERDAGLKFIIFVLNPVLNKIVSSLSMTQHIFKFPHSISERNLKLRRIAMQNGDQDDFRPASLSFVIPDSTKPYKKKK